MLWASLLLGSKMVWHPQLWCLQVPEHTQCNLESESLWSNAQITHKQYTLYINKTNVDYANQMPLHWRFKKKKKKKEEKKRKKSTKTKCYSHKNGFLWVKLALVGKPDCLAEYWAKNRMHDEWGKSTMIHFIRRKKTFLEKYILKSF